MRKLVSGASNKYSRSSGKTIKPKEGVNRYRILVPSSKDASWMPANGQFWADLGVHWIKAAENAKPMAVLGCKSIVYQQPSEVATAIDKAIEGAIDEESKKLYESWRARPSILVNVIDRSKGSQTGEDPQILELTPTTWGKVMSVIQQFDDEGADVLDPTDGVDIVITRTGKGLNTEYSVNTAPGSSKPVAAQSLKSCHDLPAYIEKEFFRGEEPKALAAIAQIAGVSLPRLASSRTPTAALTNKATQVEDAEVSDDDLAAVEELEETEVEEAPAEKVVAKKTVETKAAVQDIDDDIDVDDVLADLDNL